MLRFFIHSLKRQVTQAACVMCAAVLCLCSVQAPALAEDIILLEPGVHESNPSPTVSSSPTVVGRAQSSIIRVGMYYADNALPTANLQNYVGSGFEFGYFDSSYSFVSLGWTDETAITMAKDKNLYLNGSVYSESAAGELLGAYHVQLGETYRSYEAAYEAARRYDLAFPAYVGGEYVVRLDSFSTRANAQVLSDDYPGSSVVGESETCITVCRLTTNDIIFEYDPGDTSGLAVMPRATGSDKAITWFRGYRYYGGFQYTRAQGNDVTVMNFLNIDDYVGGVIAYEMSPAWPLEALKAQAICARSYALSSSNHQTFDVCTTTSCQVYRGVYIGTNEEKIRQAVSETAGQCAYYNGEPISAVYHSEDGGATESAENTWGGTDRPYLVGKADPYESQSTTANPSWTYFYSLSDFSSILNQKGYSNSGIANAEVTEFSPTGNVNELTFTTSGGGTIVLTGDETRSLFEDYANGKYFSRRFTIAAPGEAVVTAGSGASLYINDSTQPVSAQSVYIISDQGSEQSSGSLSIISGTGQITQAGAIAEGGQVLSTTQYTITGSGWGHNVGMSQYGARAMAELGYTYDQIISFYYTGVEIH